MQRKKSLLLALTLGVVFLFIINITTAFAADKPEADQNGSTLRILTSFRIKSMDPVKQGFWYSKFGAAELLMKWDGHRLIEWWNRPWDRIQSA